MHSTLRDAATPYTERMQFLIDNLDLCLLLIFLMDYKQQVLQVYTKILILATVILLLQQQVVVVMEMEEQKVLYGIVVMMEIIMIAL